MIAQVWIPAEHLAICGSDHAYDASVHTTCPCCGQYERIFVAKVFHDAAERLRKNKEAFCKINQRMDEILDSLRIEPPQKAPEVTM